MFGFVGRGFDIDVREGRYVAGVLTSRLLLALVVAGGAHALGEGPRAPVQIARSEPVCSCCGSPVEIVDLPSLPPLPPRALPAVSGDPCAGRTAAERKRTRCAAGR